MVKKLIVNVTGLITFGGNEDLILKKIDIYFLTFLSIRFDRRKKTEILIRQTRTITKR
jgi:hypothetical protein